MRRWDEGLWIFAVVMMATAAAGARGQTDAPKNAAAAQVQSATPKLPEYDVVSVKLNKDGGSAVDIQGRLDSYSVRNMPLKTLLANAYDVPEDLISGVTGPMASARFDVLAKVVEPDPDVMRALTPQQRQAMLRPFLVERFQLKTHVEIKELPVYDLTVVQGGAKFKQTPAGGPNSSRTSVHNNDGKFELKATRILMAAFAKTLADQLHRPVIDKSGLEGNYDLVLTWAAEDSPDASAQGPSIFTTMQEQLGLKLQSARGPVETLVVDHVEMPTEN